MTEAVKLNRRQQAKAATRTAIVTAARCLWERPGTYETVGIREIAAAAGYSTGAIFNSFTGKEDLWREAMGYEPPVDGEAVRELLRVQAKSGHQFRIVQDGRVVGVSWSRDRDAGLTDARTLAGFYGPSATVEVVGEAA